MVQVLANVGVLASVIFLAIEIRGNTVAVRSQELGCLFEQDQALLFATVDPDTRRPYVKSLYQPEELTLEELQGMTALLAVRMAILERIFQAYQDGVARPADWEDRLNSVPIYLGSSFGRVWWDHIKADYAHRPDFVNAIDDALETSVIAPDDEWLLDLQNCVRDLVPNTDTELSN